MICMPHGQEPVGGGIFEYVENVRSPFNPGYDTVGAILATGSGEERARLGVKCIPQVQRLAMNARHEHDWSCWKTDTIVYGAF